MLSLSETELVCLRAVERGGAHGLTESERNAALASMQAHGLVTDDQTTGAGFRLVRITDEGRRILKSCRAPYWIDECDKFIETAFEHHRGPVRILDVGGGRQCRMRLPSCRHLTICDTDAVALTSNPIVDKRIFGDIAQQDFSGSEFDLIIFWNVLEHLDQPLHALNLSLKALAPGGAVVIKGPVASSLQSLIAKYSPHFLHVAFYRHVLGRPDAGRPGHGPYRKKVSPDAEESAIITLLRDHGVKIVAERRFVGPHVEHLKRISRLGYWAFCKLSAFIQARTGYRAGGEQSDYFILAQRPA
jgi:SAM-dependent methyltransferase